MLTKEATASLERSLSALETVVADRIARRSGGEGRDAPRDPPAIPGLDYYTRAGPLGDLVVQAELDAADALIVIAALAPTIDAKWRGWYRQLDHKTTDLGLTIEVARVLIAASFGARLQVTERLRPDAPLAAMGVVEIDERERHVEIVLTNEVRDYLLGLPPVPPEMSTSFPATPLTTVHDRSSLIVRRDIGELLDRVVDRIRCEHRVIDEWGLGDRLDHARGLVALFHGAPGTGKSLAAAVVAKTAGLAAYRVDMQACVSKYIGETEKNLDRMFRRAEAEGCLLFFDEADAFFGKRTEVHDAHDRYANHDISYLLQRVEQHPGVVVLATNLPAALDEAFERRIDVEVEFVRPGRNERIQLWKGMIPDALPIASDVDLGMLADRYELSGGEIRNAVMDAAYRAAADDAAVGQQHLENGVSTQFAKSGRMMPTNGRSHADGNTRR